MLHATCRPGKTTLYKRYIGHRDGSEKKVHEEDEITSTVLGPLDFFSPREVFGFWNGVLIHAAGQGLPLQTDPESVTILFWNSRQSSAGARRIEPDVRVDFRWPDGTRCILLVEVKWRAPLSGHDQLHAQWQEYLTEDERKVAVHLFIAPEISAGAAARELGAGDVWNGKLVLISWLQIRGALADIGFTDRNGFGRWARVADGFLERVGILKLSGFGHVRNLIPNVDSSPETVFWQPWCDWCAILSGVPPIPELTKSPLFFNKKKLCERTVT